MAKIADRYFCTEPFSVTERGFDPAHNQVAESIFSLGNEYMGVRGFAEEGVSAPTLKGSYFNGIYEYALEDTPIHYKGIVQRTHFMINSVDWLKTEIEADGEKPYRIFPSTCGRSISNRACCPAALSGKLRAGIKFSASLNVF